MIEATASSLGIDLNQVDWNSIKPPPGEDFGIISDDEDLRVEDPEFDQGFGNIVLVDNLPQVRKRSLRS
ncbi:Eukaryotic translation initiation factor 3 subunit B [Ancistrocladus abbreviatus]